MNAISNAPLLPKITPELADAVREILSGIQMSVLDRSDIPESIQFDLIEMISQRGFLPVDLMEGVVR